jgi:5-methylcytosine-specific restriction protein A
MAPKPCLGLPDQPCPELAAKGPRCPACTRAFDRLRGTSYQRGYGGATSEYAKNRAIVLAAPRKCVKCGEPATTAGHIIARIEGGSNRLENLQPECAACNFRDGGALSHGGRGFFSA